MIQTASFRTCSLDDYPIPIEESKTYQVAVRDYGEEWANQFIVEYEVRLKVSVK